MNGASVTVNGAPGENNCETEPIWERPWSLEEIHKASGNWSLGADAGLLLFLQDFSQRMLSRTHEIEKQLDDLIQHTKATDSRLHNVFNDFLMLSNIQFIENRVYDEDVEEAVKPDSGGKPAEVEKTREQKEAELIAKVQEAVRHGLKVLDSAFEQLDIKAGNSDSEDEETTERVEHLLEPKDLYVDRPLPYIIGSLQFMKEDDVGLGDLSSEESVDSERGSIVESEEEREKEESEDDFESEEDEEKLPKSVPKQQLVSDEDEDDDSDLFHESEKASNEGVLTSSKKMGQFSFAEELAARIQEGNPEKTNEERTSLTSHGSTTKSQVKTKKETGKAKQQEESNLFGSENAEEDDEYSQFCSRGGLFSGGKGLFDDDEGDLFTEAPKEKIDEESEVKPSDEDSAIRKRKKKVPDGAVAIYPGGDIFQSGAIPEKNNGKGAKKKVTKPPPAQSVGGLFDEEDDDLFGSKTSSSVTPEPKPTAILFDDSDDSGLFETSVTPKIPKEKSRLRQNAGPLTEVLESSALLAEKSQTSSGLFSDEDESKDLVFPSKNTRKNESKQSSGSKSKSGQLPISLFDDDDDEGDLFSAISSKDSSTSKKSQQQNESKVAPSNLKSAALFDSDEGDWQGSSSPVTECAENVAGSQTLLTKEVTPKAAAASKAVKTSLFDDPEEDLFGVSGKESQKKPQKVSLLFEDDDEDDLFASKPVASKPAAQPAAVPQGPTVFSKAVENDSVESDGKSQVEWKVETKKRPPGAVPLFAGIDVLQQQGKTKLLTSNSITSQGADTTSKSSSPSSQEELQSNRKSVVSLFDDKDDEDLEETASQHNLVHSEKLPESGTSTRVFQDEELLFSHHQQKDNDPDVDLFADAQKPEVKKTQMKPPTNPPVPPKTKAAELPSHDLFDTTDSLFDSTKPSSAKTPPSKSNIFEDKEDEDLFGAVSKKPPAVNMKHTNMGPIKTKGPSSRIGKLQANLAINTASLLPGASPKFQGVMPGSASISSPPTPSKNIATAPESAVGEGSVNLNQPVQVDILHSVNKNRAKVARKRRPPTREARRLAAQQSAEVEEVDQRSEIDGASVKKRVSAPGLSVKQSPDKSLSAVLTSSIERSPDRNADPLSAATVDLDSDLFSSGDSFKSSLVQAPAAATEIRKDTLPSKEPVQSMFAPSEDDLFRSSKQAMKKPKPAFLEEEDEDLFGTAKLEATKPSAKTSKSIDIFEDDLFATESVTLTKKKNEGNTDVNLFDDNVDIFADIKIAPKEKKSRKKIETKSIFDDDMDDIFASASSSASSKKEFKPKTKSNQTAIPISTAEGKTANIFDDPLNVFGP